MIIMSFREYLEEGLFGRMKQAVKLKKDMKGMTKEEAISYLKKEHKMGFAEITKFMPEIEKMIK